MGRSVVVVGNFDGVHPGHRAVLERARALEPDLPLIVVTFWPHPLSVLSPESAPMLLTSLDSRVDLLQEAGATRVEVIDFTPEFAAWSPSRFVDDILLPLEPARVVVGENFRFGRGAVGTVDTLRELAAGRFGVDALELVTYGDEETSSTLVRRALEAGDVRKAGEHLGRLFRFRGVVVTGDHRGRELGFPTANLRVPADRACPADGVYAGRVHRRDLKKADWWPAAVSVGTNPTFDGDRRRVESYVLDRTDLDLYGVPITVEFVDRIRGQIRFDSVEALIAQMADDVARCRGVLS